MTTPNVNVPVAMSAGGAEITSFKAKGEGKEDQSFMDVLSIADSAARTKAPDKDIRTDIKAPKETKAAEASKAKDAQDVKKDSSGQNDKNVRETTKTEKSRFLFLICYTKY